MSALVVLLAGAALLSGVWVGGMKGQAASRATATPAPAVETVVLGIAVTPTAAAPTPTVATVATATPPPPAQPTPAPAPRIFVVGNTGGDGVGLRIIAGGNERIRAWPDGTELADVGEARDVSGTLWRKVKDPQGNVGWVADRYLTSTSRAPTPSPASTPNPACLCLVCTNAQPCEGPCAGGSYACWQPSDCASPTAVSAPGPPS